MNRAIEPTFDQRIADWLEEDPTMAPREVLGTVLAAYPSIPQRRAWRMPWRFQPMNRFVIPTVAALAVVIAAVLLIPRFVSNEVGPQPSPTVAASVPPTASREPIAITRSMEGRTLEAGPYQANEFAAPFSIAVPAGWIVSEAKPNNFVLRSPDDQFLTVVVMDRVYADPCHTDVDPIPFAAGFQGLIDALGAMTGFRVEGVRREGVGGASGEAFTLANSIDPRADGCSNPDVLSIGTYDLDGTPTNVLETGGSSDQLWAVNARGLAVLIGGPQAIVDAIEFADPNVLQTVQPTDVNKALRPGTYSVNGFAVELTVTLPAGWIVGGFDRNSFGVESHADGKNNVVLLVIDRIYSDPCKPLEGDETVVERGSTIPTDQWVEAFSAMKGFEVTDVQPTTVGGKQATGFTLTNSIDTATAGCSAAMLSLGTYDKDGVQTPITMFGGESDRMWIVNAGGTFVLVAITNTPSILATTQPVFDSISFGSPSS